MKESSSLSSSSTMEVIFYGVVVECTEKRHVDRGWTERERECKGVRGSARPDRREDRISLTQNYYWNGKLLVHKEEEELVTDSLHFQSF